MPRGGVLLQAGAVCHLAVYAGQSVYEDTDSPRAEGRRRNDDRATHSRADCPAAAILDKLMPCPTESTHPLRGAPLLAEVPAARVLWACGHMWACGAGDSEH